MVSRTLPAQVVRFEYLAQAPLPTKNLWEIQRINKKSPQITKILQVVTFYWISRPKRIGFYERRQPVVVCHRDRGKGRNGSISILFTNQTVPRQYFDGSFILRGNFNANIYFFDLKVTLGHPERDFIGLNTLRKFVSRVLTICWTVLLSG
jgi:hypothetical protein